MRGLRPYLALEGLQELVLIGTGELYLSLAGVDLGHFVLDEEIVYAEFFAFGEGVDAGQNAAVFVEVSRLELAYLPLDHSCEDLLYLFSELFGLALPALRGVETTDPKHKPSGCAIEIENSLDSISISDLGHLGQEGLIIQRKLRRILNLHQSIILLSGHWLKLR